MATAVDAALAAIDRHQSRPDRFGYFRHRRRWFSNQAVLRKTGLFD